MDTTLQLTTAPRVRRVAAARRALFVATVAACVPYLMLKAAWVFGSTVGMPKGSVLRGNDSGLVAVNVLTLVMDSVAIATALALSRPWGLRLPAWLLAVPMWIATGLIGPLFIAYPLQEVIALLHGGPTMASSRVPFLDGWVFALVYTGFVVQGLTLGGLFALHVRERWGQLLRGRVADLPAASATRPAQRVIAVTAALLAVFPIAMHITWSCGSTVGLTAARSANRGADDYVTEATMALFAMAAVVSVLTLAFRARRGTRLAVPLVLGWCGAGTTATWGGWTLLATLPGSDRNPVTRQAAPLMNMTYAVQMAAGLLIVAVGAFVLAELAAERSRK
ncbi:hypothetical protein ACWGCW_32345 [Streptomyces sp. NPDC054933]